MPRTVRIVGLGLLVAVVGTAAVFAVLHLLRPDEPAPTTARQPDPPTPDPRETFDTPFRNVKPGVKYVGDAKCNTCHEATCKSYHAHPMGRSADFVNHNPIEKYHPSGITSFDAGPYTLSVERTATDVKHRIHLREPAQVPVADLVLPVQIAIGSGTRGRSYLSVEDGWAWQTPVSWFGPEQKWDISPGFRIAATPRRAIVPNCLFCHVDSVEPVAGTLNRYREPLVPRQAAIGCERCHGPGELHVAERADDPRPRLPDVSIVNPKHLSPALQRAVCEQCHLQGQERVTRRGRDVFEFRPGLPFDEFVSVFVRHPDIALANKSVGQFEQMEQSRCFIRTDGKLTCTSCHDPHAAPTAAEKDAHYRGRCLTCHQKPGETVCSEKPAVREAKRDSCIACHMPRASSANIAHTSVTDHRIPRTASPPPPARGLVFGTVPLVRFHTSPQVPAEEKERDLGIALARFAQSANPADLGPRDNIRELAVGRLRAATTRRPGDHPAWLTLSTALTGRDELTLRLEAATAAAELTNDAETALTELTEAAAAAGNFERAVEAADKRVKLVPRSAEPLVARAFVHIRRGDWVKAEADCAAAVKLNPLNAETHLYLAICRHKQGDTATAVKEARTAVALEPDPREKTSLMEWFQRATR